MKTDLNWSNYATKADLKIATGANTSKFAKKIDWANLKSDVDKLDNVDKLLLLLLLKVKYLILVI